MRRFPLFLLMAAFLAAPALHAAEPPARKAATLYAQFCAGCHGADLQGGRAASLLDGKWMNASGDARLLGAIRGGVPRPGMPAFRKPFPEPEIGHAGAKTPPRMA